ncbi:MULTISPECIES: SH3 domain-containing protein [unclassified Streptomyces]|uniref:SH3 domain-containing protein n=1 Tax=unclassified Streptomyces TaxID=2593676 RepID=UPI000AA8C43E|nr:MULTISPECIES: SH3 domain-containing protein [unclassified Streptomyces]
MQIRRTVVALLTTALAGTGIVAAGGTAQASDNRCYITASAVNLRSKATTNSTALGVAYKGNKCSKTDLKFNSGQTWVRIKMTSGNAKGKRGWVREDLVHLPTVDMHY